MALLSFFTLVVLCLIPIFAQNGQQMTLYSGRDGTGDALLVIEPYIAQLGLPSIKFSGRARSACLTGMWILYHLPFYNSVQNAQTQFHYGPDNYCVNLNEMEGKVSSVRSVGNFYNIQGDSLTLYEGNYMQGLEEYIYTNLHSINLDKRASSLVITGGSSWTLYDSVFGDTRGNTVCLTPKSSDRPSIVVDLNTNQFRLNKTIRAVEKGCNRNARAIYV